MNSPGIQLRHFRDKFHFCDLLSSLAFVRFVDYLAVSQFKIVIAVRLYRFFPMFDVAHKILIERVRRSNNEVYVSFGICGIPSSDNLLSRCIGVGIGVLVQFTTALYVAQAGTAGTVFRRRSTEARCRRRVPLAL